MTPFSGPTQRSWLSPTMCDQKAPRSAVNDSRVRPTTSGREGLDRRDAQLVAAAARERQPVTLEAVRVIGLEDDVGRRVIGLEVHRVGPVERQ